MLVSTTENVAGHHTVTTLGQVFGLVVRSRGLGGNIVASLMIALFRWTSALRDHCGYAERWIGLRHFRDGSAP